MNWGDLRGKTIVSVAVAHGQNVRLRFTDGSVAYICPDGDERAIYTALLDKAGAGLLTAPAGFQYYDGTGYGDEEYEEQ